MEVDEELVRPRTLDTVQYVKDRIEQIAELLEVVDNSSLKPGEVTSGPRTVFQRLPRHMRRRAMSHNLKRLPRAARQIAAKYENKSVHRKKPPSRKWRRRPTRLLKRLQRLRRRNVWLETHIWHAKRFRMTEVWGWKLPLRSFQRGFRPTYRDAVHATVVFDLSYFCCMQILPRAGCSADCNLIISTLSDMCVSTVSPTFAFPAARRDRTECNALLYKPNAYPLGFIGPVRFSWAIHRNESEWSLQIWSHPSSSFAILKTIVERTSARLVISSPKTGPNVFEQINGSTSKDQSKKMKESQSKHNKERKNGNSKAKKETPRVEARNLKRKLEETQRRAEFASEQERVRQLPNVYESDILQVVDLRHELVRIRLAGPNSLALLSRALHLVTDAELSDTGLHDEFQESHAYWRTSICGQCMQAGNLRDGTTIALLVEDPRIFRVGISFTPREAVEPTKSITGDSYILSPKPPSHIFWNGEFRRQQIRKRLTNAQLEKVRAQHALAGVRSTPFKIPILLVVQNYLSTNGTTGISQNQIDLIAPSETGMDFWLALQFANGHAAGLSDKIHLDFESGLLSFPADCADSAASDDYAVMDANALKTKHLKKPRNRRLKYEGRLRIKYPFTFQWSELIADWKRRPNDMEIDDQPAASNSNFFVLRDKMALMKINEWFRGKKNRKQNKEEIDSLFRKYADALVALRLTQTSRGRIKRLALICLPTQDDLKLLRNDSTAIITEPNPRSKKKPDMIGSDDEELIENVKTTKLDEFISVGEDACAASSPKRKILKLDELFPDEDALKAKRKLSKKIKKKEVAKQRILAEKQATAAAIMNEQPDVPKEDPEPAVALTTSYKDSSSRSVLGRVIRGDFSFVKSRGISFGYCPLSVLPLLRHNKKVLLRNTSSKFYHQANVALMTSPSAVL